MLFDSHCHLTDDRFDGEVDAVLTRARTAGLVGVVTVASDADDAARAVELASEHPDVWATAGVHPHVAAGADASAFERVAALAALPAVVALGETGLDYHYDNSPREAQRASFARHLELARATGLPVVVHSRDADDDTAALLREGGAGVRGVLHCFAGGPVLLEEALRLDWYVSFSGMVTFRSWDGEMLLRRVPAGRLLVETDSPYLAPVPHRGRRNEPAYVAQVAQRIADLLGEEVGHVARRTTRNARAFYALGDGEAE